MTNIITQQELKYAVVSKVGEAKHVIVRTRTLREAFDQQKVIEAKNPELYLFLGKIMKNGSIMSLEEDRN